MGRFMLAALTALVAAGTAQAKDTGYIFVSNERDDTVTVVDGESYEIVKQIPTGQRPRDIRFSPDHTKLFVATSGDDRIDVIDIATLEVVDTIPTGDDPEIFDIDPSGKILVVSNEDDGEATVIDIASKEVLHVVENVGLEPEGVTFAPDGKLVYVTSEVTNTVAVIDPWKGEIVGRVLVGNRPRRGAFLEDRNEYWVTNELGGTVSIVDTESLEQIGEIRFERRGMRDEDITPVDFAITSDGETAFVTLGRAKHVARVDVATREVRDYLLVGDRVWGAALTEDDKVLVVTNGGSDDITVIDAEAFRPITSVATGRTPHTARIDD